MSASGPRRRTPAALVGATALILTAAFGAAGTANAAKPDKPARTVDLQLLSFNDFHGQIEEPTGSSANIRIGGTSSAPVNAITGGAEYLGTHLEALRKPHSLTVAAGDLIGASPLLSAAFHDEPTIETMNAIGLDVSSVGNHEFDEGSDELLRMQNGGCLADGDGLNNQNSCPIAGHDFAGADFQYLSANVFHHNTDDTLFPPSWVRTVGGVKVGFIGMTLENTPNIVTKSGVEGLKFSDEVATANRLAKRMNRNGVKSIVVLVHEGGFPSDPTAYNSCPGISGPIVDINKGLSPRIDAVITGHTHQAYNCKLKDPDDNRRLVTSGSSLGRLVTNIKLTIDRKTGDVIRPSETAQNRIVTRDVTPKATITSLISKFKTLVAPIANKVIGHLASGTTSVSRTNDDSGESPLGNLIADAQKADTSTVTAGKTPEIAFMNPGGIRADLASTGGSVTYGQAFSVQPFNNYDVSMSMTGSQILTLLDQQWSGTNAGAPKILQVSGITYSYSEAGTTYTLDPASVRVNGVPIEAARSYRVVANSFLSDGGDGFAAFAGATEKYFGGLDIDAFSAYLAAHDPYTPVATDRINVTP